MALRAVFLDVGNTLLHEEPSRFAIYAHAAESRGVSVDRVRMTELMRRAHHDLPREIDGGYRYSDPWFRAYIERIFHEQLGIPARELGAITEELFGRFEDVRTFRLYHGARELLLGLRERGLVLGVISNWSARLPRVLAGLELDGLFDFVLCSAIERMEKPDPSIFRAALERSGVAPEEALHAGDHPEKDVAGARRLGIEGVLVDHAGAGSNEESKLVRSLPELGSYILGQL